MFTTPYLDSHSTTDPKPEILSAVLTGNRIPHDGRNVRGIMHAHVCRKDDIFRQRRLNHSGVGGGIAFRRVYPARAYSTVVVLVTVFCTGSHGNFDHVYLSRDFTVSVIQVLSLSRRSGEIKLTSFFAGEKI